MAKWRSDEAVKQLQQFSWQFAAAKHLTKHLFDILYCTAAAADVVVHEVLE